MAYTPLTLRTADGRVSATGRDPDTSLVWTYKTTDAMAATVDAAGYISDAGNRGMAVGDIVYVTTMAAGVPSTLFVTSVMAITAGAADLANGTSITLTNTD